MAYDPSDMLVRVTGTLADIEEWSNSWAAFATDPGATVQGLADAFNSFYSSLAVDLPVTGSGWAATAIVITQPSSGDPQVATWTPIAGTNGGNLLPTECALRATINGTLGAQGGPFLSGFTDTCLDTDGRILATYQVSVAGSLDGLLTDLAAADWELRLNRPTVEATVAVQSIRVGRTFDVIRRRRNDLPEQYLFV